MEVVGLFESRVGCTLDELSGQRALCAHTCSQGATASSCTTFALYGTQHCFYLLLPVFLGRSMKVFKAPNSTSHGQQYLQSQSAGRACHSECSYSLHSRTAFGQPMPTSQKVTYPIEPPLLMYSSGITASPTSLYCHVWWSALRQTLRGSRSPLRCSTGWHVLITNSPTLHAFVSLGTAGRQPHLLPLLTPHGYAHPLAAHSWTYNTRAYRMVVFKHLWWEGRALDDVSCAP